MREKGKGRREKGGIRMKVVREDMRIENGKSEKGVGGTGKVLIRKERLRKSKEKKRGSLNTAVVLCGVFGSKETWNVTQLPCLLLVYTPISFNFSALPHHKLGPNHFAFFFSFFNILFSMKINKSSEISRQLQYL